MKLTNKLKAKYKRDKKKFMKSIFQVRDTVSGEELEKFRIEWLTKHNISNTI